MFTVYLITPDITEDRGIPLQEYCTYESAAGFASIVLQGMDKLYPHCAMMGIEKDGAKFATCNWESLPTGEGHLAISFVKSPVELKEAVQS